MNELDPKDNKQKARDSVNEKRISYYQERMVKASGRQEKLVYWHKMVKAIASRSLEQVTRMEAERGLCR